MTKKKKTVLCEMAFWEKFSECFPASMPFPDDRAQEKLSTWIEVYRFLSRSNLRVDCSAARFAEVAQKDSRLYYLWKKSTEDKDALDFLDSFSNHTDFLSRNPFCTLLSGKGVGPLARQYGVININGGNCLTKNALFIDNGQALHKDDVWSWEDFGKRIPEKASNSMIIVDNYILRNGVKDLYEILNLLLPDKCEIGYHLTIFYSEASSVTEEKILNEIGRRKPELIQNLQFELIHVVGTQEFHDRAIITNNYWISVGGGFDIAKWDSGIRSLVVKRSTTTEIAFPYFASSRIAKIDDAYENLIQDAKIALSHANTSSRNRLLTQ